MESLRKKIAHMVKGKFYNKDIIGRQDLYELLQQNFFPKLKESTFRWRIYELKQANIIMPVKRGVYKLAQDKKKFLPSINSSQRRISNLINKTYNDLIFCTWNSNWLNEFSRHQAFSNTLIIEVEKELTKPVFHLLIDNSYTNVYIDPDKNLIDTYISENNSSIVVKPLISKSPVKKVSNIVIPQIEKILVDLFCNDKMLYAYKGHEQITIFESAFNEYQIDISRLINYSRRRKKEKQLVEFLIEKINQEMELFT